MNAQKYTDSSNKIEYHFLNFDRLAEQEMKDLVARYGRPRKNPFGKQPFKNGIVEGTVDFGEVWEDQIIYRQPSDPKTNSPEEIKALEIRNIFSGMMATD